MTGLEVIRGATVKIVEKTNAELQRAAPVCGLRRFDDEFVDILFDLFEVEADDPEVAGVVELQEIEAERFPIEGLRRPDGEGFANKAIVNFAGVLETDPVDLEGLETLCPRSAVELGPTLGWLR